MKIKTNIKAQDSYAAIAQKIQNTFPNARLSMDMENADSVLHVHGIPEDSIHAAKVISAIEESGFEGSWLTRGEENK